MNYGYVRVSTIGQNIDRQIEELYSLGLNNDQIFIDKQSGKNFERVAYKQLLGILKENDLVIVKSIDRLGRNYDMIIEEWTKITKEKKCDILVIDMPLLDTRQRPDNLIGRFISDIVLQILSFVAQNERENIIQRQTEGIRVARLKGVKFGRKKLPTPENFEKVATLYLNNKISSYNARLLLGDMSRGTFYRRIKNFTNNK